MKKPNEAKDLSGLSGLVEELADEFRALRQAGGPSVQDVQQIASRLTELQLLLNELERIADEQGTDNSRFSELGGRIRLLRGDLYDELRRDRTAMNRNA